MKHEKLPALIIDAHNLFIRSYIVSPRMSKVGETIGGVTLFLQTFINIIERFSPTHVFVCWEGGGGSSWRRSIYKDYKERRRPRRLNRDEGIDEQPNDELRQMLMLAKHYLKHIPVKQFFIRDCEADDVIAYIVSRLPEEKKKLIVSTDKDFMQLISDTVQVYNPVTKVFVTPERVMDDFSSTPQNVVLARAFLGDKSDNIPGIKGVGPKWIEKNLPLLREDTEHGLPDVVEAVRNAEKKGKVHQRVLDELDALQRNFRLMNLASVHLTGEMTARIDTLLEDEDEDAYTVNRLELLRRMGKDGVANAIRTDILFREMNGLLVRSRTNRLFGDSE